jgi:phosphatidylserine/phosphatidylglycerophosphate/cardiolipin synthase-like enzyme
MFRGHVNIAIRVKQGSERNPLHLKAYCIDHRVLRDGSANWSPGGEKCQDNNARFTSDPQQIAAFERAFDVMWNRTNNLIIQ